MSEKTNGKSPHLTFGVRVPNSGPLATVESMVEVAQEAESLGFDSVWVHDHLTWSDEIHRTHISSGADHGARGQRESGLLRSDDFAGLSRRTGSLGAPRHRLRRRPCRNPLLAAKQIAHPSTCSAKAGWTSASASARRRRSSRGSMKSSASIANSAARSPTITCAR